MVRPRRGAPAAEGPPRTPGSPATTCAHITATEADRSKPRTQNATTTLMAGFLPEAWRVLMCDDIVLPSLGKLGNPPMQKGVKSDVTLLARSTDHPARE